MQSFGKYQILERIATGGMAEIFKARLEGIGGFQRTFAIKRVLPHLSSNAEYVAMLVDEAKVAGLLSHANIVQILDLGQVDNLWYIAMEYVDGRDLGRVLKRVREKGLSLPLPHTVFVAIELLKGLEYAHQRQVMRGGRPVPLNIIHRDVSPPNILLSFQGEVKLTDFGIARASHKALETRSGVVKGRFDYMSPEQAAASKDLDHRSDLFAVGVVLYEMLTGTHPFRSDSEYATLEKVRTGQYEPVSVVNPGVPFQLETIVDRALRVDRDKRYPTATAFKEALDKFFHDSGFIFTHATLAAYVKSLFPESQRTRREERAAPKLTVQSEPGVLADPDGPTRLMSNKVLEAEERRMAAARDFALRGEEATLIRRRSPLSASAAPALSSEWADDQETVIKRSPFPTPAPPAPPAADPPTLPGRPEPETPAEPLVPSVSESSAQPLDLDPESVAAPPPRRWVGVLGAAAVVVVFALGVALGGAAVAATLTALDSLLAPAEVIAPPTLPDPVLRFDLPGAMSARVNGLPVSGERTVTPDQDIEVKLRQGDTDLWRETFSLQPGEVRVIVVPDAGGGEAP